LRKENEEYFKTLLNKYVKHITRAKGNDIVSIMLFGSVARGEARFDSAHQSDLDLIVVVKNVPKDLFDRVTFQKPIEGSAALGVNAIWHTPEEFIGLIDSKPGYFLDAVVEGKIVYDPSGFARKWRNRLVKDLKRRGVQRTDVGWEWPVKKLGEEIAF
jgi:predicted nucleotidyltransferase